MNINWFELPSIKRPRIEMLRAEFGYDVRDRFTIQFEDSECLYFDDIYKRYTNIEKNTEGKEFIYIRKGKTE